MSGTLSSAPVFSTPDDLILQGQGATESRSTLSEDVLRTRYEIARTTGEIRGGGWNRIALQFPDHMLVDAPRVVEALKQELSKEGDPTQRRICILADTSYSACCVDEVAAEHVDADVVVHYGRTCLSPTSRLPVVYVYTSHELDHGPVVEQLAREFGDKASKIVIMADLTYQHHVQPVVEALRDVGYSEVLATKVERNPSGIIPNRVIEGKEMDEESLKSYSLFHISDPPQSLLLALHCRFASLHILSVPSPSRPAIENPTMRTAGLLRRRYAKVLSLASAGVIGILVNTLSVTNYLSSIDALRSKIARAGKKSYTVVVGKLNPAKLANFAEIQGWVVVGCWESGLMEDDAEYWRPVATPFELEAALTSEEERVWGGEWWGGIEKLSLHGEVEKETKKKEGEGELSTKAGGDYSLGEVEGGVDGEESLPPVFDFRTGRLVSTSRPMHLTSRAASGSNEVDDGDGRKDSDALVARKMAGEVATINGVASPGAEFLRSQRTWQGLGGDFDEDTSTVIEEGRSGIARGYRVGEEASRH